MPLAALGQEQKQWLKSTRRWAIYRPDFQAILYESALDAGAQVEFGQKIARMDIETASVVLEDGSIVCGDLVIGADGVLLLTLLLISLF